MSRQSDVTSVLEQFDAYKETNDKSTDVNLYTFSPKFQKSTKNNPLCGICFPQWFSLLRSRFDTIEWSVYWPRIVVISILSVVNTVLAIPEYLLYSKKIDKTEINPRPVFILGHPRTGTTMLHSLLALDDHQFAICSTFCAGFPSCFLWFEAIGKRLFRGVIDKTRPMDNVPLHFDLPQEDELATNVLVQSLCSPYMPLFLMREEPSFRPFYAFDDQAEEPDEQLPPEEMAKARKDWTTAFLHLLKKLTLRSTLHSNGGDRATKRLLLKSPVHTARIPLLLQLFPEAQFIYIHRHPHEVFQSAAHMADTTYWYTYLNTPDASQIQEFILRQYEILWDRYQQGKKILRSIEESQHTKRLVELSYNDLTNDPKAALARIYDELGWILTPETKQRWQESVKTSYVKNSHRELSPELKRIVNERWGASFESLGYSKSH